MQRFYARLQNSIDIKMNPNNNDFAAPKWSRQGVNMQGMGRIAPSPIRLPQDLKDYLKHRAIDNRRSLNNEILLRLEQSRETELKQEQEVAA